MFPRICIRLFWSHIWHLSIRIQVCKHQHASQMDRQCYVGGSSRTYALVLQWGSCSLLQMFDAAWSLSSPTLKVDIARAQTSAHRTHVPQAACSSLLASRLWIMMAVNYLMLYLLTASSYLCHFGIWKFNWFLEHLVNRCVSNLPSVVVNWWVNMSACPASELVSVLACLS